MLKKISILIVVIIIMNSFVSCAKKPDSSSAISSTIVNDASKLVNKLDIDPKASLSGIVDSTIIYCISTDNYNDTGNYEYFKYDIKDYKSTSIGIIENVNMFALDYAFINNQYMIVTKNVAEKDERVNNTYLIDYVNNEIVKQYRYNTDPPLVFNRAINENIYVQFQPEYVTETKINYNFYVGDENGIKKIMKSNPIDSFCPYNGFIYLLEGRTIENEDVVGIGKYDIEGNEIEFECIDLLTEFTNEGNATWELTISKNLYSFNTRSINLALYKNGSNYERIEELSIEGIRVVRPTTYINENQNIFIYWNIFTKELFKYAADSKTITKYNFYEVKNVICNDEYIVYQSENGDFYLESI